MTRTDWDRPVWIVGVDGSSHANVALRWAMTHAPQHDAVVHAVLAWDYPRASLFPAASGAVPVPRREDEHRLREDLEQIVENARRSAQPEVVCELSTGSPAYVLLDRSEDAELVVVGSRGRGGFASLALGSVGLQLVTHARRPTVVVPSWNATAVAEHVLVGVDGSPAAAAALRWADGFAGPTAHLTALTVGREEHATGTCAEVKDLLATVDAQGHRRFERQVVTGEAAHQLVHHASQADLLVIGASHRHGGRAGVPGSVTNWVMHHLQCPTALIPPLG